LVLPKKRKNAPLAVEERKENARRQNAAGAGHEALRPCFLNNRDIYESLPLSRWCSVVRSGSEAEAENHPEASGILRKARPQQLRFSDRGVLPPQASFPFSFAGLSFRFSRKKREKKG